MNQTPNYQLSQWEASDRIQRTDFNADNAKIDAAIAGRGNCKIITGSYVGDGTYNSDCPKTLTFEEPPLLLFLFGGSRSFVTRWGERVIIVPWANTSNFLTPTWTENSITWSAYNAQEHFNMLNTTYHYIGLIPLD